MIIWGSGKIIISVLNKYDLSCFLKEILFDFNNFDEMNAKEKELLPLSNCWPNNQLSYNLREGGQNGEFSDLTKEKISIAALNSPHNKGKNNPMYDDYEHTIGLRKCAKDRIGKTIDEIYGIEKANELRQIFSENTKGENNPMFGKNPYANKTEAELKNIIDKRNKTNNAKTDEQKEKTKIKIGIASKQSWKNESRRNKFYQTLNNRTPERKKEIADKCRKTLENKSKEEKELIHAKLSKASSGKNNGMFGKKLKDIMPKEKYLAMCKKISESLSNMPPDKRKELNKLHSKNITGRKQLYNPVTKDNVRVFPKDFQKYLEKGYIFSDTSFIYLDIV